MRVVDRDQHRPRRSRREPFGNAGGQHVVIVHHVPNQALGPGPFELAEHVGQQPVGACLVSDSVSSNIKENDLGTTFGGGMLAMAAVLATLDAIEEEKMAANARAVEDHLRDRLAGFPNVIDVRGKGCLLGIEFSENCTSVHSDLLGKKIITGTSSDPRVLRLLPPLNVTIDEIDLLVEALKG